MYYRKSKNTVGHVSWYYITESGSERCISGRRSSSQSFNMITVAHSLSIMVVEGEDYPSIMQTRSLPHFLY